MESLLSKFFECGQTWGYHDCRNGLFIHRIQLRHFSLKIGVIPDRQFVVTRAIGFLEVPCG